MQVSMFLSKYWESVSPNSASILQKGGFDQANFVKYVLKIHHFEAESFLQQILNIFCAKMRFWAGKMTQTKKYT